MNMAADMPDGSTFDEFLPFETLTLCQIDPRCLDHSLRNAGEIDWLSRYHATVLQRLAPLVSGYALAWLTARTRAV